MLRTVSVLLIPLLLCAGCSGRNQIHLDASTPRDLASFDRAIDSLKAIAKSNPTDSEILNQLGLLHYKKAKWMYETMKYRVDFQMQRVRGKIETVMDEATRNFDTALRLRPSAAEVYRNKAMVCVLRSEWEQDDEHYMRNCRDALAFLRNADSLRPQSSENWYWKGVVYSRFPARKGESDAVRCFEKALELDSKNPRASFCLAELQSWKGSADDRRLANLYSNVADVDSKDAELMRDQSALYFWAVWSAEKQYWKSLKSVPDFVKPMLLVGIRVFESTDIGTRVRESIAKSGFATPDDYLGLLYSYSADRNTRKTSDVYRRLLEIGKYPVDFDSPWGGLPEYLYSFLRSASKLEPSLPWIYFYYGKYGKTEEARSLLLKAIDLDPSSTLAYYLVAVWYYEQKDYENAIIWLKLVVDRKPADEFAAVNAHQLLTLIYLNKGEVTKAIGEYKNSVKLDSTFAAFNIQHSLYGRVGRIPFLPERPVTKLDISDGDERKIASNLNTWGAWSSDAPPATLFSFYVWNRRTGYIFNDKQLEFLKSAVDLDSDNQEAYLRLATYYVFSTRQRVVLNFGTGNFETVTPVSRIDEAIKVLQSFLKRHPESRKAHYQLAQYYNQTKMFARAAEEYKAAARLGSALALDELERMGEERSK